MTGLTKISLLPFLLAGLTGSLPTQNVTPAKSPAQYSDLVALFREWRTFEKPPLVSGAPDYTADTFNQRWPHFKTLQNRLLAMDTKNWTTPQKVDWKIVWAEMNGYDFNHRVLKPWERDPAFYVTLYPERSDVPAHEGPTHHATLELWTYSFPLDSVAKTRLLRELAVIPPLHEQARRNLTGNARELWRAGIRPIRQQSVELQEILARPGVKEDSALVAALNAALVATDSLADWLVKEANSKTGPSGIGRENYTWYQQNVHLVPLTWEDEVMLLKRELARAWSSLKLEEQRNRRLPPLKAVATPQEFKTAAEKGARSLLQFLTRQEIVTVKDYYAPALRAHLGNFVPADRRNFFLIGLHYDARPLYSHFYHWFELAQMDQEPHASEIRRTPLLYNIFDSRNEGMATAVEEIFMHAGLYEDNPRAREIVYIMLAQRAARGLGSLYAHANEMTMEEAGGIHSEQTPRGWMKTEKDLLIFEQHLYLRQPGYGTSYITGKYLLEHTLADFARQQEARQQPFRLKDFFDRMNAIGCIPVSLGYWELIGE